jgi:CRISPR system Cascade subunit CasE
MAYLSRLILNPRSRRVQRDVADPYQRHRTIMAAFPDPLPGTERVLHRLEHDAHANRLTLLVQSDSEPDWRFLEDSYLLPADPLGGLDNPAVKPFELALRPNQVLSFRLRANPTVKKKRPGQQHGNRVPLVREEQQLAWLQRQARRHGFRLLEAGVQERGSRRGLIHRNETGHRLSLYVVQFDGRLVITDVTRVLDAVRSGIGPAKAFGCGLLSLAPA